MEQQLRLWSAAAHATDRHGFLTWPDKTRTWHDQPAAYVGEPAQGPQDVHP